MAWFLPALFGLFAGGVGAISTSRRAARAQREANRARREQLRQERESLASAQATIDRLQQEQRTAENNRAIAEAEARKVAAEAKVKELEQEEKNAREPFRKREDIFGSLEFERDEEGVVTKQKHTFSPLMKRLIQGQLGVNILGNERSANILKELNEISTEATKDEDLAGKVLERVFKAVGQPLGGEAYEQAVRESESFKSELGAIEEAQDAELEKLVQTRASRGLPIGDSSDTEARQRIMDLFSRRKVDTAQRLMKERLDQDIKIRNQLLSEATTFKNLQQADRAADLQERIATRKSLIDEFNAITQRTPKLNEIASLIPNPKAYQRRQPTQPEVAVEKDILANRAADVRQVQKSLVEARKDESLMQRQVSENRRIDASNAQTRADSVAKTRDQLIAGLGTGLGNLAQAKLNLDKAKVAEQKQADRDTLQFERDKELALIRSGRGQVLDTGGGTTTAEPIPPTPTTGTGINFDNEALRDRDLLRKIRSTGGI